MLKTIDCTGAEIDRLAKPPEIPVKEMLHLSVSHACT